MWQFHHGTSQLYCEFLSCMGCTFHVIRIHIMVFPRAQHEVSLIHVWSLIQCSIIMSFMHVHILCTCYFYSGLPFEAGRGGLDIQHIAVIVAVILSVMLLVAVAFFVWCIVARVRHSRKIAKFPTGALPPDDRRRCVCLTR